jgi:small subunit ribosomal protein S19
MSRSLKKGLYIDKRLLQKVQAMIASRKSSVIKTWSRACTIIPEFVGFTFAVHNGHKFVPILVTENMIGRKLGEFSLTRLFKSHGGKLAKEKSKK